MPGWRSSVPPGSAPARELHEGLQGGLLHVIGRQASAIVLAGLAFLALMLPAIINGSILLFPDSVGYFHAGEASIDSAGKLFGGGPGGPSSAATEASIPTLAARAEDGISTSRSVYYGIPFVALYAIGGSLAVAAAQALIVLGALLFAVPRLTGAGTRGTAVIIAAIALLGGLGMFTATAMPDMFTGLMVLAFAMLLPNWPGMSRHERTGWLLLLLAACLVHKSNLAAAAALAGLAFVVHLATRRSLSRPAMIAAVIAVSFVGHAAVVMTVERLSGKPAVEAPFVLARLVGDGTAKLYLDRHCPEVGLTLCRYRDRLPMTENEFLWSHDAERGVMHGLPVVERAAITQEANRLVIGALSEFPLHQIAASLRNLGRQLLCVGVTEFALGPQVDSTDPSELAGLLGRYPATPAGRRALPFDGISAVMLGTYLVALAVLGLASWRAGRAMAGPRREAIGWILVGLLANAAITGMISGVFDRYQGRVAWLAILAALAALASLTAPRSRPA